MNAQGPRRKGIAFENKVRRIIEARFAGVEVRRSSQAERAYESDLFVPGHPLLSRLWIECCDGHPRVRDKLEQAERDVARGIPHHGDHDRLPVVVWHRLSAKEINVTMRLVTLIRIAHKLHYAPVATRGNDKLVTLDLHDFLDLVAS